MLVASKYRMPLIAGVRSKHRHDYNLAREVQLEADAPQQRLRSTIALSRLIRLPDYPFDMYLIFVIDLTSRGPSFYSLRRNYRGRSTLKPWPIYWTYPTSY